MNNNEILSKLSSELKDLQFLVDKFDELDNVSSIDADILLNKMRNLYEEVLKLRFSNYGESPARIPVYDSGIVEEVAREIMEGEGHDHVAEKSLLTRAAVQNVEIEPVAEKFVTMPENVDIEPVQQKAEVQTAPIPAEPVASHQKSEELLTEEPVKPVEEVIQESVPVTEPVDESVDEPVAEPVTEPVTIVPPVEPAVKPVVNVAPEPVSEAAITDSVEVVEIPATPDVQTVTEDSVVPGTELIPEPVQEEKPVIAPGAVNAPVMNDIPAPVEVYETVSIPATEPVSAPAPVPEVVSAPLSHQELITADVQKNSTPDEKNDEMFIEINDEFKDSEIKKPAIKQTSLFGDDNVQKKQEAKHKTHERKESISEKLQKPQMSVNDVLSNNIKDTTLASQMQHHPVANIKSVISINDRIWFVKELFDNNNDKYNKVVDKINTLNTYNEALDYLSSIFNMTQEKESLNRFFEIVQRRFISK